jgi:hypothetical protein
MPRSGQLSTSVRVAITARRGLNRESPAVQEAVEAQLTQLLAATGLDGSSTAAAASCADLGDALRMLRQLGLDLRRLSPAARAAVRDAERVCAQCPITCRCARFFAEERHEGAKPAFCPNLTLFREFLAAAEPDPLHSGG